MSAGRYGPPLVDATAALAACQARDYNVEGIEMYLVLEDAEGRPLASGDEVEGRELAELAGTYLAQIAADPSAPTEHELGCALEILAAHHFEPVADQE